MEINEIAPNDLCVQLDQLITWTKSANAHKFRDLNFTGISFILKIYRIWSSWTCHVYFYIRCADSLKIDDANTVKFNNLWNVERGCRGGSLW